MENISAVYKITNEVTGDFYIGSSVDVKARWTSHKSPSCWKDNPNSPMYQDMQKYGLDKFRFQILAPVMSGYLTQVEQEFIDMLHPTYNAKNAKGLNVERRKESAKKHRKEYQQSDKGKEVNKRAVKKYGSQLCEYNGETLTLDRLRYRFHRAGIKHSVIEAKKYLKK